MTTIPPLTGSGTGNGNTIKYDNVVTVADSNITLTGEQVINGVSCVEDDRVLLTGQSDASENGIWVVGSGVYGAWSRPTDFPAGGEAEGAWTHVTQGTDYDESIWFCVTNGTCTIDTDDQEWRNVNEDPVDGFNIATLTEDSTNSSLDYIAKHDGTGMEKIKRNDFLNKGIKELADDTTITINLAEPEECYTVQLGGNRTLALTNANVGEEFTLRLEQDGTGSRTVTWFATINWPGGSAPTLTTTADRADYFRFKCTATNTYDNILQTLNLATSTGSSTALGSDVLMYYALEESSGDRVSSVNASHALTPSGTPGSNTGKNSDAVQLNGTTQYLYRDFGPGDVLDFEDSDFTIAMWLNFDSVAANETLIYGPTFSMTYDSSVPNVRFFCYGSGTGVAVSTATVTASNWHLFVCTHDSVNDLVKISINGETYNTTAFSGGVNAVPSSSRLYFGADETGTFRFGGLIDEIGIWGKALTQAEVTALYNSGTGKFYPFA